MSRLPSYRYAVATREGSAAWVDTSVEESIDEILALVRCALQCGQSIMVEPINDYQPKRRKQDAVPCQPDPQPRIYQIDRTAAGDEPDSAA